MHIVQAGLELPTEMTVASNSRLSSFLGLLTVALQACTTVTGSAGHFEHTDPVILAAL